MTLLKDVLTQFNYTQDIGRSRGKDRNPNQLWLVSYFGKYCEIHGPSSWAWAS